MQNPSVVLLQSDCESESEAPEPQPLLLESETSKEEEVAAVRRKPQTIALHSRTLFDPLHPGSNKLNIDWAMIVVVIRRSRIGTIFQVKLVYFRGCQSKAHRLEYASKQTNATIISSKADATKA